MADVTWVVLGVGLLYGGGEALVRGARSLAVGLGIQPVVIGLTVVAFGTSVPELAATLTAALRQAPEVAFGNVVGSNIANLGLALGLAAMVCPLFVKARFLAREVPFMLGSSLLMMALAWNGRLGRFEGLLLLALLVPFLVLLLRDAAETPEVRSQFALGYAGRPVAAPWVHWCLVAVGVALLAVGARVLITGGVGLARAAGIEERVIGLTLVAVGTSLPEVASTLVAAGRREGDIVVGNLIGSNVFNALFILGATVVVRPLTMDGSTAGRDLAVMLGFSLLVWPLLLHRRRLGRSQGLALTLLYTTYVLWLFTRG